MIKRPEHVESWHGMAWHGLDLLARFTIYYYYYYYHYYNFFYHCCCFIGGIFLFFLVEVSMYLFEGRIIHSLIEREHSLRERERERESASLLLQSIGRLSKSTLIVRKHDHLQPDPVQHQPAFGMPRLQTQSTHTQSSRSLSISLSFFLSFFQPFHLSFNLSTFPPLNPAINHSKLNYNQQHEPPSLSLHYRI